MEFKDLSGYEFKNKPMDYYDWSIVKPSKLVPHEVIPPEVIEQARAAGLAGEWKGTVDRSIFQIDLPNGLGDIWGSGEQALKLKKEIGVHGVRVIADLEKLDTTKITKTKIQSSSSH